MKIGYYWVLPRGFEKPSVGHFSGSGWCILTPSIILHQTELDGKVLGAIDEPHQ